MKKLKKFSALFLALAMVVGMILPSMGKSSAENNVTNSVTLHKLLLDSDTMNSWDVNGPAGYDGKQDFNSFKDLKSLAGKNIKEIPDVFFALKDSTGKYIKASIVGDKLTPELQGGSLQTTENPSEAGALTGEEGLIIDTSKLPQKTPTKYTIVEVRELSKYVGEDGKTLSGMKAVPVELTLPFVNNDGVQTDVHVYPKNTEIDKPTNDKTLDTSAEANTDNIPSEKENQSVKIGDKVPYVVTSTIPAGSTYNKLAWSDKLSKGLTLNKGVAIEAKYNENGEKNLSLDNGDYKVVYSPEDNTDGFVLELTSSGLKKLAQITAPTDAKFVVKGDVDKTSINGKNTSVTFTLKYSAKVNSEAVINNPLQNTNTLHYGNNPGYTPEPGDNNPPPVTPNNGEINVNKSFANGPLSTQNPLDTWPDGLVIKLGLQVYEPGNNIWKPVTQDGIKELSSIATSAKWTNLDNSKQYRVVEEKTTGWVPNYAVQEDGTLKIVNKKNDNPPPITPEPVIVRTGGKKFVKTNQEGTERLKDAEFVVTDSTEKKFLAKLTNDENDENQKALVIAETKYQNAIKRAATSSITGEINQLKIERDAAAKKAAIQWKWEDSVDKAHKFVTNTDGQWGVYGLAYGTYKYKEIAPPKDYAKNETPVEFVVSSTSFATGGNIDYLSGNPVKTNDKDATQIINKKVTIPQTGGIGTIIFALVGIALMGLAVYAMKRNAKEEE